MSYLQFDFESQYLNGNTTISVILPDRPHSQDAEDFYNSGKKYRVLWLLHGTFGDHSDWIRKSMIEIYAREKNLICVMPSGLNADYVSWPKFGMGFDMESHLIKELMPLIQNWFPASNKKEDNFIAGLSMGGRGVIHYILNYPDKFAAAAVLSFAPVMPENIDWDGTGDGSVMQTVKNPRFCNMVDNVGGKEAYLEAYNYWQKMLDLNKEGRLPKMLFGCGTKDVLLYNTYSTFKENALAEGLPVSFGEIEGVGHEWRFWDPFIQEALKFFGFETDQEKTKLL